MSKILALSGKKQSGKSTTANWIIGQQMCAMEMVSYAKIDHKGRLVVPAVVNDELTEGIFDPLSPDPAVQALLSQYVWPVVKLYSFADILKMSVCAIFGLEYENVNGTDEQKNQKTKFKWSYFKKFLSEKTKKKVIDENCWNRYVTGRDILQVVGTDIFRNIYGNIWVDACIKRIQDEQPELAIITDCRFPNEVEGVQKAGGKVVRFLRAPFADTDEHESETALDNYPLNKFDHVFDNRELTIEEQNEATNKLLSEWDYNTWDYEVL